MPNEPKVSKERRPAQEQTLPPDAETTRVNVQTPEPIGKRLGEAGSQYVGRPMDDRLKANPRVDDARDVQDGSTPRVHPDDPAEGAPDG
jgi:hypothetical protein